MGMDIPIEQYSSAKEHIQNFLQGQEIIQGVFDGKHCGQQISCQ